jgi:hypothetical protein
MQVRRLRWALSGKRDDDLMAATDRRWSRLRGQRVLDTVGCGDLAADGDVVEPSRRRLILSNGGS